MRKKAKIIIPFLLITAAFLIETVLSYFPYFAFVSGNKDKRFSVLNDYEVYICDDSKDYSFQTEPTVMNSISFRASAAERNESGFYTDVTVYAAPESSPESLRRVIRKKIGVTASGREKTLYFNLPYKVSTVMLDFSETGRAFYLSDIKVNPVFKPNFSIARFLIIAVEEIVIYLLTDKESREFLKGFSFNNVVIITVILSFCISAGFSAVCMTADRLEYTAYPLEYPVEYYNPYVQQFDAFQKGQLHLDVEADEELALLENPYDPIERADTDYLWDRAYYNGKYYSYFGTAPIFTVYYPYYFLTGTLPADSLVSAAFSLMVSVFLPLAVMFLSRLIDDKISPWFASLVSFGALGASLVYLIQRGYSPFYYIASIAGMAFASAALFFAVLACTRKKYAARVVLFALAGISFALCIHSRLNAALPVGIALAAYMIAYFIKSLKSKKIGAYFGEAAALAVPVVIGAAAAMLYNKARFGSLFDFGTAYQLTVADTSTYKASLNGIFPTIYHCFLQPFSSSGEFPFVSLPANGIDDLGKYVYTDSNIGIFAMPFMLSLLLSVSVFKSKRTSAARKAVLASSLGAILLTAFLDLNLGGAIFRYTADISLLSAFVCSGILMQIYSDLRSSGRNDARHILFKGTGVLCLANTAVTAASALSINGNLTVYSPEIFEILRSIFVFWK